MNGAAVSSSPDSDTNISQKEHCASFGVAFSSLSSQTQQSPVGDAPGTLVTSSLYLDMAVEATIANFVLLQAAITLFPLVSMNCHSSARCLIGFVRRHSEPIPLGHFRVSNSSLRAERSLPRTDPFGHAN